MATTVSISDFYLLKRLQYATNTSSKWYISTSINNSYIKNSASGSAVADSSKNTFKSFTISGLPTIGDKDKVYLKGHFKQESEQGGTLSVVTNAGKDIRYNGTSIGDLSGSEIDFSYDITSIAKASSGGSISLEFVAMMSGPEEGSLGSGAGEYSYLQTTYKITNFQLIVESEDNGTIYYHNGTEWKKCKAYYYNGSSWVECEAYRHDGTSWKKCGVS